MPKETSLYPEIKDAFEEAVPQCHCIKVPGGTYSQGIPDFLVACSKFVGCEVKVRREGAARKTYAPTPIQQTHLDAINRAGGVAFCLVYWEKNKMWYIPDGDGEISVACKRDGLVYLLRQFMSTPV